MLTRVLLLTFTLPAVVAAEEQTSPAASVEDNIRAMDQDHDGIVTVTEVRAYLEAKNGKGYRHELLDEMEGRFQ